MVKNPTVSVIIPTYNEKENIEKIIRKVFSLEKEFDIHNQNEPDRDYFIEWVLWRLNLIAFFIALFAFVIMLFTTLSVWILLPLTIMAVTFSAGFYFTRNIPNVFDARHLRRNDHVSDYPSPSRYVSESREDLASC